MTGLLDTNVALYLLGGRLATTLLTGSYGVSVITEMKLLAWPLARRRLCHLLFKIFAREFSCV